MLLVEQNAGANVQQWSTPMAQTKNGNSQSRCGNTNPSDTTPNYNNWFHTNGTTLYDAKGNPFIMCGINHAYSWYPGYEDTAIPAIARTGANCVRLVITDGQQYNKTSLLRFKNLSNFVKITN